MANLVNLRSPSPVNWGHSLNKGRGLWLMVTPNRDGGSNWTDLTNKLAWSNPALGYWTTGATLSANMFGVRKGFKKGTTRPGGYGEMIFDGTGQVYMPDPTAAYTAGSFAVSFWMKTSTNNTNLMGNWNSSGWGVYLGTTGYLSPNFYGAGGNYDPYPSGPAAVNVCDGVWRHVVLVYARTAGGTGMTIYVYINGNLAGSGGNGANTLISTTAALRLGVYGSSYTAGAFIGSMDDFSFHGRALVTDEVRSLYELSKQGYPGLLNYPPAFLRQFFLSAGSLLLERRRSLVA